jgi:aromatic-L-amino-acid decarboxylase
MRPGLVLYITEHSHSSCEKAAIALGFGQENVRKVPADAQFRMRPDLLEKTIEADLAEGKRPCCIVATVGSTAVAAIDPVPAIAAVAERFGLWLHVDAAYAGAAAVLPEKRPVLDGVERAHSLVINPHKWLYIGVDCSVLYTRRPDVLRRASSLSAEYLRTSEDDRVVNYMDYGIQLGRRFRALKLWYVFRHYGREGIMKMLRNSLALAKLVESFVIASDEFELCAPVNFSLVCFRHRSEDAFNAQLLASVNATGKAFLSHAVVNGQYILRFAIGNFMTEENDVRETWELIRTTARQLTEDRYGRSEESDSDEPYGSEDRYGRSGKSDSDGPYGSEEPAATLRD